MDNTNALLAIWGYDSSAHAWQVYQPSNALPPAVATLALLTPGKGYWVKVSRNSVLQLSGAPWSGDLSLVPGWNLVGFPGLFGGVAGKTDFASVLRDQLASTPAIWAFQGGSSQRFLGYDAWPILR